MRRSALGPLLLTVAALAGGCGSGGEDRQTVGTDAPPPSTQATASSQSAVEGADGAGCATGGGPSAPATSGPGSAEGGPFFAPDSPWNTPLDDDAPRDPASARLAASL